MDSLTLISPSPLCSGQRKSIGIYVVPMKLTFLSLVLSITKRMSWYVPSLYFLSLSSPLIGCSGDVSGGRQL
jgi:hypothetical protein